jgi:hypothetical protein
MASGARAEAAAYCCNTEVAAVAQHFHHRYTGLSLNFLLIPVSIDHRHPRHAANLDVRHQPERARMFAESAFNVQTESAQLYAFFRYCALKLPFDTDVERSRPCYDLVK